MRAENDAEASRGQLFAWALYDWANSAFAAVIQTFVFAAYFTRQVAVDEASGTAQWGTTIGLAGVVVALGGPWLGAVADQLGPRKPWIALFTGLSVAATGLLWFVEPSTQWIWPALLLVGLGTLGSEFANIFYNAMLPVLAGSDRAGRWSGWAWALGYAGGLACLVLAFLAFLGPNPWLKLNGPSAEPVRAIFVLVAAWYLVFSLPLLLFAPDERSRNIRFSRAAVQGAGQLISSIHQVGRYGPIVRFLIAHLVYTDGLAALFAFGGVYAAGTFAMTESEVLAFGIGLNVTAGIGAFGFAWLADWRSSKMTVVLALMGLTGAGMAVLLVESVVLFWTFGLLLGLFVGPVQAASRSYLARLSPPELSNQMFGFYALSGKATAFLAPFIIGWVTYWTQSQRMGMSVVLIYFLVGLLLMLRVPVDRPARAR